MSHVVKLKGRVDDLDLIFRAFKRMGAEVRENNTYQWYGRHVGDFKLPEGYKASDLGKCQYEASFPGVRYSVGILDSKTEEGCYDLLWDFVDRGIGDRMGERGGGGSKFLHAYAAEKARLAVLAEGYEENDITETVLPNGAIKIEVETEA